MTLEKTVRVDGFVRYLELGIYRLYWKDGGMSVAAVGQNESGDFWYAPADWTSGIPCFDWDKVAVIKQVTSHQTQIMADKNERKQRERL